MLKPIRVIIIVSLIFTSCAANLLPQTVEKSNNQKELEQKGKDLLEKVWLAQGLNLLEDKSNYEYTFTNTWKGLFSGIGKLWPQKITRITQRSITRTFDSQIEFLDGKTQGVTFGLQSWNYYEIQNGKANFDVKPDGKSVGEGKGGVGRLEIGGAGVIYRSRKKMNI